MILSSEHGHVEMFFFFNKCSTRTGCLPKEEPLFKPGLHRLINWGSVKQEMCLKSCGLAKHQQVSLPPPSLARAGSSCLTTDFSAESPPEPEGSLSLSHNKQTSNSTWILIVQGADPWASGIYSFFAFPLLFHLTSLARVLKHRCPKQDLWKDVRSCDLNLGLTCNARRSEADTVHEHQHTFSRWTNKTGR